MHLNKIVKSLAVVLPLMALAACTSSTKMDEQTQVDNQTQIEQQAAAQAAEQENVRVAKMNRDQEIIEQEKREKQKQLLAQSIVYFDYDVSTIPSASLTILDAHAKYLNKNESTNLLIEGHADERGTPEYNIALGERRGKAIQTYLENMGVSSSQLNVVSYGEEKPMVKDRSESAFAKNRRAVLVY
jgi:peptidoglycan-associated lipoprotein